MRILQIRRKDINVFSDIHKYWPISPLIVKNRKYFKSFLTDRYRLELANKPFQSNVPLCVSILHSYYSTDSWSVSKHFEKVRVNLYNWVDDAYYTTWVMLSVSDSVTQICVIYPGVEINSNTFHSVWGLIFALHCRLTHLWVNFQRDGWRSLPWRISGRGETILPIFRRFCLQNCLLMGR